jgi:pyruvate kinase
MSIARVNTKYASGKEIAEIVGKLAKMGSCRIIMDIKDNKMIGFLKTQKFDYLAVSFSETAEQLKKIRKLFAPRRVSIIAKIETKKGVRNIDKIIKESDGVMVARGDLGRNVPFEKVPILQKLIIKRCKKKNKFAITATEMLLSMTKSQLPERSETSDVANAVLDGSDALMLSEETAIGKYPVLAVQTMKKITAETEKGQKLLEMESIYPERYKLSKYCSARL